MAAAKKASPALKKIASNMRASKTQGAENDAAGV